MLGLARGGRRLGVAVVGTILTSRFASSIPASPRTRRLRIPDPPSVEQLGSSAHAQAINAFTDAKAKAKATGYRVVAAVVLTANIAVATGLPHKQPAATR